MFWIPGSLVSLAPPADSTPEKDNGLHPHGNSDRRVLSRRLGRATPFPHGPPAPGVWDALRDFGALHTRLVPGFVLDTKLDGDARIVTFANGTVTRELLVDCDEERRRLVYAVSSERIKQHSASVQVFADGD